MIKLITGAAAVLAFAAAFADAARARGPEVVDPPRLTVELRPRAVLTSPRAVAAGRRTIVFRNASTTSRAFWIVRVPGGTASLTRFEGLRFLPSSSQLVRDLGGVAPGRRARAAQTLSRGDYVLAALDASVVVAAHDLRVT